MALFFGKKKAILQRNAEIQKFIDWYFGQISGKRDFEVNFVSLGYDATSRFHNLFSAYPVLTTLPNCKMSLSADNRHYQFLDTEGTWCTLERSEMEDYRKDCINNHPDLAKIPLDQCGPLGLRPGSAYEGHAYLSFAYNERKKWNAITASLKSFIAA
ncbi:MAG: hypothetical protein LBL91_02800 [Lachnospiraceae bacterium]|jgi:hypothetical protein|nr:hypothetical protein [Lachnospiraceae bacterium]